MSYAYGWSLDCVILIVTIDELCEFMNKRLNALLCGIWLKLTCSFQMPDRCFIRMSGTATSYLSSQQHAEVWCYLNEVLLLKADELLSLLLVDVLWMWDECMMDMLSKCHGCVMDMSWICYWCTMDVLWMCYGCCEGCVTAVLRMCFWCVNP